MVRQRPRSSHEGRERREVIRNWKKAWERVLMTAVITTGWGWMVHDLFHPITFVTGWSVLVLLGIYLFVVEYHPHPAVGGKVTLHFPLLYALSSWFSPSIAGLIFVDVVLVVTWLKRQSFSRSLFRTGYTLIGLFAAGEADHAVRPWLSGLAPLSQLMFGLITFLLVYELVSKGIRDGVEQLIPASRRGRTWWGSWPLEPGLLLLSFLYSTVAIVFEVPRQPYGFLGIAFFFAPLVGFAVLLNIIARLKRQQQKMELLFVIATRINQTLDLRKVMKETLIPLSKVIDYTYGVVYLLRDGQLYPEVFAGDETLKVRHRSLPLNRGLSGWVASHAKPACIHDVRKDPRCKGTPTDAEGVKSLLSVPLEVNGEVMGVITLGKTETYGFRDMDLRFLTVLASQAVVAMRTAKLMEERERRVVAEERNRLAREIHDGIGQSLAGVLMKVESAARVFDTHPERVRQWLEEAQVKLREGLKEVRHSITALRPSPAARLGLLPALRQRVEAHQRETGQWSVFQIKGRPYPLLQEWEETIYQVCHEALNNVAKHAQATKVRVQLRFSSEYVRLIVQDDGVGFSLGKAISKAEAHKRYGIVGMNERAQKLEAALQFLSKPNKGTRVILTIPTEKNEEESVHVYSGFTGG
jgi:signal transduction histidine kinase